MHTTLEQNVKKTLKIAEVLDDPFWPKTKTATDTEKKKQQTQ